ncbi:MAG: hypothetical protein ACXVEE_00390 [Polyangiales bacterium]
MGASLGMFDTTIVFPERRASLREEAVAVSLDRRLGERTTFQLSLGAVVSGRIEDTTIEPGPLASIAFSYRLVDESKSKPFVIGTFSFAASRSPDLFAADGRLGVAVGKTFARTFAPFAIARVFGGPVRWRHEGETFVGGDSHHYQLGLGALFIAGRGIDASLEIAPLGERRVSAGLGAAF